VLWQNVFLPEFRISLVVDHTIIKVRSIDGFSCYTIVAVVVGQTLATSRLLAIASVRAFPFRERGVA